jgi:hypothetical protein
MFIASAYATEPSKKSCAKHRLRLRYFFGIVCCLALALASARIIAAIAPSISSLRMVDVSLGLEINRVILNLKKLAIVHIVKTTAKK